MANSQFQSLIDEGERIVFFGGAGTSTESGIPDFRSAAGLYQKRHHFEYPPEVMLSRSFFQKHTEEFYSFYYEAMLHPDACPNAAHLTLAKLEEAGKLSAIITQNIDGLHQKAGSKCVLELHGSVHRNTCLDCGRIYGLQHILEAEGKVPVCKDCGGIVKPDVVLYEDSLDFHVIEQAALELSRADVVIVGGTSLTVQPAASLIQAYTGPNLILINRTPTHMDHLAKLVLREPMGELFSALTI